MAKTAMQRAANFEGRFDSLYRAYHPEVLAYFVRRIPKADAEDAAAEVFTVAWRRFDQIPADKEAIAWLYGVAHRVLSNHRRGWRRAAQLRRRLGGLAPPPQVTPESQVVMSAADQMLIEALDRLRPPDREILKLATWERLSHDTIGDLLGINTTAVGQRISRARKRLGKQLDRIENKRRPRPSHTVRKEDRGA